MKLRDIVEQIDIQGKVIVKEWDEQKETDNILMETESFNTFSFKNVLDRKIEYLYAIDKALIIEVEYIEKGR